MTVTFCDGSKRRAQRAPVRAPEFTFSSTLRSGCTASMKPARAVCQAVIRIADVSPIGTLTATFAWPPMPPPPTELSENSPKPSDTPISGWFVM